MTSTGGQAAQPFAPGQVDLTGYILDYKDPDASSMLASEALQLINSIEAEMSPEDRDLIDWTRTKVSVDKKAYHLRVNIFLKIRDQSNSWAMKTKIDTIITTRGMMYNGKLLLPRVESHPENRARNRAAARWYAAMEGSGIPKDSFKLEYSWFPKTNNNPDGPTRAIVVRRIRGVPRPQKVATYTENGGWAIEAAGLAAMQDDLGIQPGQNVAALVVALSD